ncbi:MAG: hypothetical protein KJ600_05125 [Nanoarchaeota archaeon]|nr:hypothetical protein [Nanoarchaeota archaeon]MBU1103913.1 hypothetical protein [Nanoarchaeota archaeon]
MLAQLGGEMTGQEWEHLPKKEKEEWEKIFKKKSQWKKGISKKTMFYYNGVGGRGYRTFTNRQKNQAVDLICKKSKCLPVFTDIKK